MKYDPDEYVRWNPFEGDEAHIECRTVRLVKVRKEHVCFMSPTDFEDPAHTIKKGEMARFEKALIDRSFWGSYYICTNCMDRFIDELYGVEDESA